MDTHHSAWSSPRNTHKTRPGRRSPRYEASHFSLGKVSEGEHRMRFTTTYLPTTRTTIDRRSTRAVLVVMVLAVS